MSDFHENRAAEATEIGAEPSASWLEPASAARPGVAPIATTHRDGMPFDLAAIAAWLPRLGAVLWLDRSGRRHHAESRATIGTRGVLLLDHPALAVLARCTAATAHTQVTTHGPREWVSFRDADGVPMAKLFLLPDTDYLAWDEMISAAHLAPAKEPARWHAHTAFLRTAFARLGPHWQARLLTFAHRRLPWLQTLDARPPLRLSLLGVELARLIANSEGAELLSPLHAA